MVIAPVDHPGSGLSEQQEILQETILVHGGTSLKLCEGSESPVLVAHPGSPVDITGRRPSLTTAMAAQRLYHGSEEELLRLPKSAKENEEAIRRDGVIAKGQKYVGYKSCTDLDSCCKPAKRRAQGNQPFYIPAKVPEQDEVIKVSSVESKLSIDTSLESTAMDFEFEEEDGLWISATPIPHDSQFSLDNAATRRSTLDEDRTIQGTLTLDTSVASSAASMMSSIGSIQSASTGTSDIYGWEEELERKTSVEGHNPWERDNARRLPSGGRSFGPRARGSRELSHKQPHGKRKSLLYRVLNISGSRERGAHMDESGDSGLGGNSPQGSTSTS